MIYFKLIRVNEMVLVRYVCYSKPHLDYYHFDILILRVGIQAPDEVSVPCAEFAGLSLDILRPSSMSCNTLLCDE